MCVLPAVLPDTREIPLDVTGLQRRVVEGRREEEHEAVGATHEIVVDRGHGAGLTDGIGRRRDHAPRLRDRIDAARVVDRGAEGRPIIEVRAPIPVAVPGLMERRLERVHITLPLLGALPFPAGAGQRRPLGKDRMQEPPEPDALPFPLGAHFVHPVVPIPGAHQRQAVRADRQAPIERARAVLEERALLVGDAWLEVRLVLGGRQHRSFEKGNDLVEHSGIAGNFDIPRDDVGKPD